MSVLPEPRPTATVDDCAAGGCTEVLAQVYVFLDGEMDGPARAELSVHLEECGPCLREFGIEEHVKALVHRCCGNDVAPQTLRDGVLATLRAAGCGGPTSADVPPAGR